MATPTDVDALLKDADAALGKKDLRTAWKAAGEAAKDMYGVRGNVTAERTMAQLLSKLIPASVRI